MAFLFDTDAISEVLKPRPAAGYVKWLASVPRGEQFTSRPPADADLQIAATAILHDLELVTGNVKHFKRVPRLRISPALADARAGS